MAPNNERLNRLNSIPPQAYTRDTLVKAIEWLSTQPPAVRERASSADLIVSCYLQAKRKIAAQMEAPVSGETFKNDLKHLVEDLKQFDEPSAPPQAPSRSPSFGDFEQEEPPVVTPLRPDAHHVQPAQAQYHYVPAQPPPVQAPQPPPPQYRPQPPPAQPGWTPDARSLQAARAIQQRFNLSNENEAFRFLISMGIERAKEMMGAF